MQGAEWFSLREALDAAEWMVDSAIAFAGPLPVFRIPADPQRLVVCTRPGVDGLIMFFPTDDSARPAFLGVADLLRALHAHRKPFWKRIFGDDYWSLRELPLGEFIPPERFVRHAPQWLELAESSDSLSKRHHLRILAASFLDEDRSSALSDMLDEDVRAFAVSRLRQLGREDVVEQEESRKADFVERVAIRFREMGCTCRADGPNPLFLWVRRGDQHTSLVLSRFFPSDDVEGAVASILGVLDRDLVAWRVSVDDNRPVELEDSEAARAWLADHGPAESLDVSTRNSSAGLRAYLGDDDLWHAQFESRTHWVDAQLTDEQLRDAVEELLSTRALPISVRWKKVEPPHIP